MKQRGGAQLGGANAGDLEKRNKGKVIAAQPSHRIITCHPPHETIVVGRVLVVVPGERTRLLNNRREVGPNRREPEDLHRFRWGSTADRANGLPLSGMKEDSAYDLPLSVIDELGMGYFGFPEITEHPVGNVLFRRLLQELSHRGLRDDWQFDLESLGKILDERLAQFVGDHGHIATFQAGDSGRGRLELEGRVSEELDTAPRLLLVPPPSLLVPLPSPSEMYVAPNGALDTFSL